MGGKVSVWRGGGEEWLGGCYGKGIAGLMGGEGRLQSEG